MIKYIVIFITLYLTFSIIEWTIHKYIMHNENNIVGKKHITHHKSTNDDMTLNKYNENYDILSESENLCFEKETIILATLFYIIYFLLSK